MLSGEAVTGKLIRGFGRFAYYDCTCYDVLLESFC